jgi:hypothetical protein
LVSGWLSGNQTLAFNSVTASACELAPRPAVKISPAHKAFNRMLFSLKKLKMVDRLPKNQLDKAPC